MAIFASSLLVGPTARASEAVERGAPLYAEHCASCHGKDLEGAPNWRRIGPDGLYPAPPHDETGHTWHHGDRLLFDYTKLGGEVALDMRGVTDFESGMPGFTEVLTDIEIHDILAFIMSTWPDAVRRHQEQITRQEASSRQHE
ncbi:MAG: cytochrome c [Rhodospirillales bacterium]|nr:cytochrome c [Rhodospirillales bacterium]